MNRRCDSFAELRSGLVDDALTPADRERVVDHLLRCEPCRRDVAELRGVRELLAGQRTAASTPTHLSDQLRSIAGTASADPLWTRAFGTGTPTALPSYRRRAQRRAALGVIAIGMVVSLVGLVGWFAAPAAELSAVPEPAEQARGLNALAGELSISGVTATALILVDARASASADAVTLRRPGRGKGAVVDRAEAAGLLRQALLAAGSVSTVGRQGVLLRSASGLSAAAVDVDSRPGLGTRLSLVGRTGTPSTSLVVPATVSAATSTDVVGVLVRGYDLNGRQGARVAGRTATTVQASRDGRVVKRWWIDDATKIVLWQESYDSDGRFRVSTGFSSVRTGSDVPAPVGAGLTVATAQPARLAPARLPTSVALDTAARRQASGWACTDRLAGLDLLQLSFDTVSDPDAMYAVYGDGLRTLAVQQQRGRLPDVPRDARWDESLRAWRHDGTVRWATWQSGDTVVTVTTEGPASLLAAASALPRREPVATTTLGRVRDGWSKILADSKG